MNSSDSTSLNADLHIFSVGSLSITYLSYFAIAIELFILFCQVDSFILTLIT